jgi:hypothetical protein
VIRHLLIAAAATGIVFAAGCKHKCWHKKPDCCPPAPFRPAAPGNPYLLPPANLPTTPTPIPGPGSDSVIPPVGPPDLRNYPPPVIPGKPGPELILPEPIPGSGSSRSDSPATPGYGVFGPPVKAPAKEPPVAPKPANTAAGLPGFTKAKDGVATGRKPSLEGFDSLKHAGYRTVVYLHPAGADTSAAKDVAATRKLSFVPIETTPEKLADAVALFNGTVRDRAMLPAYVYDDDGLRTGVMWYLHFRTVEAMNDDAARVRAKPLGFTTDGDEAQAFALATQRYLETR